MAETKTTTEGDQPTLTPEQFAEWLSDYIAPSVDFGGPVAVEPIARTLAAVRQPKLREALLSLARSVENYLDHPGCNNPARVTAMTKLRWAMDEARKVAG